ncbi:MAG: hypothetical protein ACRDZR_11290 [Acidimicrobiales bacterium]
MEVVPPETNRGVSVAGQDIRLGGRKPAAPSCRDGVVAAFSALAARDGRSVFTVREVYAQMVAGGTRYAESIVFKTMQRMKDPSSRTPYPNLQRVGGQGFRFQGAGLTQRIQNDVESGAARDLSAAVRIREAPSEGAWQL